MRATREGVRIIGSGHRKADGKRLFAVSSSKDATRAYMVVVLHDQLVCDCQAGQGGKYCKHRATVTARLYEETRNKPISIFK